MGGAGGEGAVVGGHAERRRHQQAGDESALNALRDDLVRLERAELIFRRGVPPNSSYVFKHALIQETAYQSLLKMFLAERIEQEIKSERTR